MEKNKTGKYLKYAIGEIILVVIGILIALQVNNWNQSRKTFNQELQLYSEIYNDLHDESRSIENYMKEVHNYQRFHFHVYNESKGKAQYDSTIVYNYMHWTFRYNMFFNIKYANKLSSITDVVIRKKLKYYLNQEHITNIAVTEWNDYKLKIVQPFFNKHGVNNSEVVYSVEFPDFQVLERLEYINYKKLNELYGTIEFDQLLFDLRYKTTWIFQNLIWLKKNNKEFKEILKSELKLHNITDRISYLESIEKYEEFVKEADSLYDARDYKKSVLKYKKAFEQKEPSSVDRYNAACSFALAKDVESAFYHLFTLVNGTSRFNKYEWVLQDSDLEILYKDIRWKEITSIIKANIENEKNK